MCWTQAPQSWLFGQVENSFPVETDVLQSKRTSAADEMGAHVHQFPSDFLKKKFGSTCKDYD